MAGIYLHIPFCRQACHYCNFHFSTSLRLKNDFITALLKEMEWRKDYLAGERVETIYFGGGTPSLLPAEDLEKIMERLYAIFTVGKDAEVTLEANPDDIVPAGDMAAQGNLRHTGAGRTLAAWKKAGINRLSIGIQSFFEEDLQWMNRAHTAGQAIASLKMAQEEGFDNFSVDLIYGSPTLSDEHWMNNLQQVIDLKVPHLSCYALTVEPRTALDKMIRQHIRSDVDPDQQARQFFLLRDRLETAGYEHYEISNFALPGKRSRHNSSYWQGRPYLGLGPSAHSYDGLSRQWNIANNARYIEVLRPAPDSPEHPAPPEGLFEKEVLTPMQQLNEYIMISLRTMEGCDLMRVAEKFGKSAEEELFARSEKHRKNGSLEREGSRLILTREGKFLADGIASDLFFT